MLAALSLPFATLAMMLGAIAWGVALRRRKVAGRNQALARLPRLGSAKGLRSGELTMARGLATTERGAVALPGASHERAVWVRLVMEELARGWIKVIVHSEPRQFRLALGEGRSMTVDAADPETVLLPQGGDRVITDLFDDETPEELLEYSREFYDRVEAQRAEREALYRVRLERVLEGESVLVAAALADGDTLGLQGQPGSLLSTLPAQDFERRPRVAVDVLLLILGAALLVLGVFVIRVYFGGLGAPTPP